MLNLEIDGRKVEVAPGSTVLDAANKLDIYVPHFCYHKKLSIAANCRMCLVQVEKAPKPLPACATPATEGMKVWTHSDAAVNAHEGVMEVLPIIPSCVLPAMSAPHGTHRVPLVQRVRWAESLG